MGKGINKYIKASVFYMFGNGIGQGIIFLSSIIFTRIMTQEDYGLYTTYYSVVTILNTLVGANLFNGLNNAYIDYKDNVHKYRASNLFLSTIVFAAVSVITIIATRFISVGIPLTLIIMALIHAYGFFVLTYYRYSANMENKYVPNTVFMILPNVLQVAFSIVFIKCLPTSGVNARVIGSTLGVGVCAIAVYIYMISGQLKHLVTKEYWKFGLAISVPSVLSSISYMLMSQCDHLMITAFKGAEETAVYGLIYNIGFILVAVMQATNGVLSAWLYRTLDSNDITGVRKVQKWYLFVYGAVATCVLMISPEVIKIMSPESYWQFEYVAPFVIASYLMVMYSFYTIIGLFYKKSTMISICVVIAAVINFATNAVFIPRFGGIAAAFTSAGSYLVLFIMLRFVGQKLYKNLFSLTTFIISFAIIVALGVLFNFVYSIIWLRYAVYIAILVVAGIYVLLKKSEWVSILKEKGTE